MNQIPGRTNKQWKEIKRSNVSLGVRLFTGIKKSTNGNSASTIEFSYQNNSNRDRDGRCIIRFVQINEKLKRCLNKRSEIKCLLCCRHCFPIYKIFPLEKVIQNWVEKINNDKN